MTDSLPFPVRVAVGLVATGVEYARRLPEELPAWSVAVTGQAVRTSMRIQQEIAALASRGEEVLAEVFNKPEEHPAWARFDEDEDGDDAGSDDAAAGDGSRGDDAAAVDAVVEEAPDADADPTPDMPGYDSLRVTQVRARMRALDAAAIGRLLDHERSHADRAAFVTLLQNRLTTLQHDSDGVFGRDGGIGG